MSKIQRPRGGGTLLCEVDATQSDTIVHFITESLIFPTYVTRTYSGLGVKFVITFQAIQNFIPDGEGRQIPNTITNSLKIFNAFDTDDLEITDLELFVIENVSGNVTIKAKTGVTYPETLVLPQTDASGNTITHIDSSFANLTGVKNLVIPSGYTTIEAGAFKGSSLENVDMSDSSITEIPDTTFYYSSSLTTVILPEGIEVLGKSAFYGTPLSSINLPSTLKRIENSALWNIQVSSLYIPASVEYIAEQSIRSPRLIYIEVDDENKYYYDDNNETLLSYAGELLHLVVSYEGVYEIPEGVVDLFNYCLSGSSKVTSIVIPESLTTIGEGVFPSYITSISVDENNTSFKLINDSDLASTSGILIKCFIENDSDYSIPDDIILISTAAISNCRINTLTIGKNLMSSISYSVFSQGCQINKFVVDEENKYFITDNNIALIATNGRLYKFSSSYSESSYTVHESVTHILPHSFYKNSYIESVILPSNVINIQYSAFIYCENLKNISMTSSMTSISESFCATGCAVEEITVYGNVTNKAFSNNTKIKKITFGEGTTNVGTNCMYNCVNLETVIFESTTPTTLENINIFGGTTPSTYKIYVPDEALETYKNAENFSYYANKIYPMSELNS